MTVIAGNDGRNHFYNQSYDEIKEAIEALNLHDFVVAVWKIREKPKYENRTTLIKEGWVDLHFEYDQ